MIRGRFGETTGRPYLEGRLVIPRLGIRGDVSFLVDTGADSSLIGPADGLEMGIDYTRLSRLTESVGTGGMAQSYREKASIAFIDAGKFVFVYHIDLDIAVPHRDIREMPSLLGREVLDRWRMVYDPSRAHLSFAVRTADTVLPV